MLTISLPLALLGLPGAHWLFLIPIALLSIFLTLLILVQRGRGGGLTGALGGMGGQSAFGTKAGDVFTKITIVTAMLWILLSMGALRLLHVDKFGSSSGGPPAAKTEGDKKAEDDTGVTPPLNPETTPPTTPSTTPSTSTPAPSPPAPASTPAEDDNNK